MSTHNSTTALTRHILIMTHYECENIYIYMSKYLAKQK